MKLQLIGHDERYVVEQSLMALFPGELDMQGLLQVNAGLFALWLAIAGLCFLSACLFSNATAALWAGGGLCILFFLMQMVSKVGDKFEFLENVNP